MAGRAVRSYTPEQRAEGLSLYLAHGPAEAGRRMGIPTGTIAAWASRAGLQTLSPTARIPEHLDALRAREAQMREELRLRMLDTALHLIERVRQPHVEYMNSGKGPVPVVLPSAPAKAVQNYATSVAILLDKVRLESGEAEGRQEHWHGQLSEMVGGLTDHERGTLRRWIDGLDLGALAAEASPTEQPAQPGELVEAGG